jgi:HNH endonuclease
MSLLFLSHPERMFVGMGYAIWSTDELEQELLADEAERSRLTAKDMAILEELDYRQVATTDGCRSLSEWTTARLDIHPDNAKSLVRTMRRTVERPDLRGALATGEITFDRMEALSRIPEEVGPLKHLDVAGVCRQAANRARISTETEYRTGSDQFLVMQPSLDQSWWKLWGGFDGATGALVNKTLSEKADDLPLLPDGTGGDSSWRKAIALAELCITDDPPPAQLTVFVDTTQAVPSNGQAGVVLEAGPRIGRDALEAILCDAVTEVTAMTEDGTPMVYGRKTRTIPPALRRAIIHRDGNTCEGDGCPSTHRLQVHHIIPWSEGGTTDPENLITLCWYHHQIVVHQRGFQPYRHPQYGRIRFRKPPCAGHRTSPPPTRPRSRRSKYPSARWFDASPGRQLHGILKVVLGTGDV